MHIYRAVEGWWAKLTQMVWYHMCHALSFCVCGHMKKNV